MHRFYSANKNKSVALDVKDDESVVLTIEPFTKSAHIHLQFPQKGLVSAFCSHLHQDTEAFTVPLCVTRLEEIPEKSYFVLLQDQRGYLVFFCLSHQDVSASLSGSKEGIQLNLVSGNSENAKKERPVLLCLRGKKMHETIRQAMELALCLTGGKGKLLDEKLEPPHWLDSLGWESGVAMGPSVSHSKILESVKHLTDAGYRPGFVLIDEGWQHLEQPLTLPKNPKAALASFEADVERFPKGIKGVVDELKVLGIKYVGVWHGMMGYRGGVHPTLAKKYDLPMCPDGRYFLGYDLGRTFQFFYDYYGYLREQGVTFIKVGDQSSVHSYCHDNMDATLLYNNLQAAMQAAASIQFNSAHFNTECLRNENLFYWGNSRIARTAEDIDVSDPLGVMQAIRNNLTNSLWMQHLMQPDFDAWLTDSTHSETLAIFHALSGSINVIGDLVGEHNRELINKFVLPQGHLLKADRPLTLCQDSVFCNPIEEKKIYKAFTFSGEHGIVGAFNLTCGKRTLHGHVSPKDVEGLEGDQFALLSHYNGFVKLVKSNESVAITLKPCQSDVFTFAPVHNGIAVLGCYPFFLAPGPIVGINIEEDSMHISSLVAARLLIYCQRQILEVRRNGKTVPWDYDSKRRTLSIDSRAKSAPGHALYSIIFEA